MLPRLLPRPLGMYHPALAPLAHGGRIVERLLRWQLDGRRYATTRQPAPLAHRVKKHQSVLIRRHPGVDLTLQHNKVENLRRVIERLDGLIIAPKETFSFCRLVGRPSRARGFLPGVQLSRGEARPGIGGGICQASNLIYWLALHSDLAVIERHHHSFDPFPDQGRVLPFASGATVMWPYRDLRLFNPTPRRLQLRLWLDHKCLNGELRSDGWPPHAWSVTETDHRFTRHQGTWWRSNTLWRLRRDRRTGVHLGRRLVVRNRAEVKYVPSAEAQARRSSTGSSGRGAPRHGSCKADGQPASG